jgi:hypothetical protein
VLRDDGTCVVTIGDVINKEHGSRTLATEVWEAVKGDVPLDLAAVIIDDVNEVGKVSKIWGVGHRGEATKTERVLVLHKRGARMPKPRHRDPIALIERIAAGERLEKPVRPGVVRAAKAATVKAPKVRVSIG